MMEFWVNSVPDLDMADPMAFEKSQPAAETEDSVSGVNFSAFMKDGGIKVEGTGDTKTSRRKKSSTATGYVDVVPPKVASNGSDKKYSQSFAKTTMMLEGAIMQTDELAADIKSDIDAIRSSKTLKSKYTYLTNLTGASASLISTKVNAIREINSSIKEAAKLELDEMKITKDADKEQNDDTRVMELYKAFVNTPIGSYSPNVPGIADMALPKSAPGIVPVTMNGDLPETQLTPEQIRMRMENNPNILTVVKFNQSTGQRFFDVIDRTTGASLPNYPRPDDFLLDNTNIDVHTMTARNKNIDTVWPLIFIGDGQVTEY